MAWLAIDLDGQEVLFASKPTFNKEEGAWIANDDLVAEVNKRTIEKIVGRIVTFNEMPIEI